MRLALLFWILLLLVIATYVMSFHMSRVFGRQQLSTLVRKSWVTNQQAMLQRRSDLVCSIPYHSQRNFLGSSVQGRADPVELPVLIPPPAHEQCSKWIIFSDLHVKGSSINVCEAVLDQVHKAARQREAGIIFLGDFWHVRGALSVELLNRVLTSLAKWECLVVMIPGNHDQVTLGGKIHSLEPLKYAFKPGQILMINEPAVCMGALWIPYRRDASLMKAILNQASARQDISMVFCHADVKGAYMNDNMRSMDGLDITRFPKDLPIYSGHFHKPHTISKFGSTLRYVGSPYQTSLAEAGQDKFFYCVERSGVDVTGSMAEQGQSQGLRWREAERWVVRIGSRIIKASSPADPSIHSASPGDRLVVTVPLGQEYAAQALMAQLSERDILVELHYAHNPLIRRRAAVEATAMAMEQDKTEIAGTATATAKADVPGPQSVATSASANATKVEDMDPLRIFERYMSQLEVTGLSNATTDTSAANPIAGIDSEAPQLGDLAALLHERVLKEGRETIERLLGTAGVSGAAGARRVKELVLDRVVLSNFRPYGGERAVEYPLSKRGLVLIRGRSTDGTGADSNGAGKTTLAMSVLWGLTGSLDARMVGDAKSADVSFDSVLPGSLGKRAATRTTKRKRATAATDIGVDGASVAVPASAPSKLTAEAIVTGTVNGQPFEVIRRRSARKAELHFTLNGAVLTTQAVKDTQALIDEHLGIQGGLLQRCCFFGQHTHTLQSLLGLTDVKLKQELAALVDTSLWSAAAQDVRTRDRAVRKQLTELAVEARLRREEHARAESARSEANASVARLQTELEQARHRAHELPSTAAGLSDLSRELDLLQMDRQAFAQDALGHLRAVVQLTRASYDAMVTAVDSDVSLAAVETARLRAVLNATSNSTTTVRKRLAALEPEHRNNTQHAQKLEASCGALGCDPTAMLDPARLRADHEAALGELTSIELRIGAANVSLSRLSELHKAEGTHGCSNKALDNGEHSGGATLPHKHAQDDACPTCGQEMPAESRERRLVELHDHLGSLIADRHRLAEQANTRRQVFDTVTKLLAARDALEGTTGRMSELQREAAELSQESHAQQAEVLTVETKLADLQHKRAVVEAEYRAATQTEQEELAAAEMKLLQMQERENDLQARVKAMREAQEKESLERSTASAQVTVAQDRVRAALHHAQERGAATETLNQTLADLETTQRALVEESAVLDRLATVLGPRGVQNFIFQNVIEQLESITNSYLMVLADGGIQLALQNTGEEDEKIVKTVWVRSLDTGGEYRERALGQLSGGQWRRVSLALDFAFAELIRRRGVLRCNLMVMDEVLTHLDASGRESVGTVLRAMVQGPPPAVNSTTVANTLAKDETEAVGSSAVDEFGVALPTAEEARMQQLAEALLGGGAYETVIVILQDLAAAELEEAFDHVDVVVKERDASTVLLDE